MAVTEHTPLTGARCRNCGEVLSGDFCARCGQRARDVKQPFLSTMQQLLHTLFELDGRAYRTIYYLFTRPGFLSLEYVNGRRARYTPPLRLFLVISIGFFLIVSVNNTIQSTLESIEASVETPGVGAGTPMDEERPTIPVSEPETTVAEVQGGIDEEPESADSGGRLDFSEREDLHEFIDTVEFGFLSADFNNNLRAVMHIQADQNFDALNEDPEEVFYNALQYVTVFMLIMMPILALIQKIVFILSRRYYIEHLVLTVHNHAFLFAAFFLMMVSGWVEGAGYPSISPAFGWIGGLIGLWVFAYLYLSLKRFFNHGHFVTFILFIAASLIYLMVSSTGLFFFAAFLFFLV